MPTSHRTLSKLAYALFGLLACLATSTAAAQSTGDIEAGRKLYMHLACFSCHGTVGQGGERSSAPRLAPEPYPLEAFTIMVRNPREAMPRYDTRSINDEQMVQIHRYLASIPKGLAAKDIPILQSIAR